MNFGENYFGRRDLYHLSISAVAEFVCSGKLTNSSLKELPNNCKNTLFTLISRRGGITEHNIDHLLTKQTINADLSGCDITNRCITSLTEKCPSLRSLNINVTAKTKKDIESKYLERLFDTLHHLNTVCLKRCDAVTDFAIMNLTRNCGKNLLTLNVGGCVQLTDLFLKSISKHCLLLQNFTASGTAITDRGMSELMANGHCAKRMTEVDISNCKLISDVAIEATIHACTKLTIFIFHGCPLVTDDSRIMLEHMHEQRSVKLTQVTWTVY